MTWFKVDDKLHDHRKARAAGSAAMGLWVLAGSWSADNLEDGFVPESVCQRWDRNFRALAAKLVKVELWHAAEQDGERGWRFHQWDERQPMRAEIEKKRAEARERMANRRGNHEDGSQDVRANAERTNTEVLVPVPSRPVPSDVGGSLGGDRPVALRALDATQPTRKNATAGCLRHPNGNPADEPCAGCKRVNERDQRDADRLADRARIEAEEAARNCVACEGTHFVLDDEKRPTRRKCTNHRRTA